MEADVIVVGAGLAGHCAALEAAATGADVILLEKQPEVGGSTVLSGGSFAFAGTDEQKALKIEDSPEILEADFLSVGDHFNNPALVRLYADRQLDAYRWLKERGVAFGPIQTASGQSVPRQHPSNPREAIRLLSELVARTPKIRLVLNAPAGRLIRAPGSLRVTEIELASGERAKARCGVVLTSGGFSRNREMIKQFAPQQMAAKNVGGPGNVGDGIKMAWQLGADVCDMPFIKGTFGNHPAAQPEQHTAALAIYRGAIAVNQDGRRFANESVSYKLLGDACLAQPGHVGYQIFDEAIFQTQVRGVPIFDFAPRLEQGLMLKADTLKDLAGLIGVPAANLKTTIETYNNDVEKGHDSAFGRRSLVQGVGDMKKIGAPPFYAYPSTSALIATYCGVKVDIDMRVVDVFGEAIPALYAAGEMTGGFHGAAFMTGTSLGKCVICGRIAGRNAASPPN